jgi:hypothetical protein
VSEPEREMDPRDLVDGLLLSMMRARAIAVAPGVLAEVIDDGGPLEVRSVLADEPGVPGAVGRWLDTLPRDRKVIVPAVVSPRLAGMLVRRGFARRRWFDARVGNHDDGAYIREARRAEAEGVTP